MFICIESGLDHFARFFEKKSMAEENLFHFSFGWKFLEPAESCVTFLKRRLKCHDLHFINGKYHQKNPCVKIINLPWKFSIFRTWKIFSNAWKKYLKVCVKPVSSRENFETNHAWKPFSCVKKVEKTPKNGFTQGFHFHVQKKSAGCSQIY